MSGGRVRACVAGLKQEAVKMIETLFRCAPCDDVTSTECVLRHWQFVHNKSTTAPGSPTSPSSSAVVTAPPCSLPSLVNILRQIGRHDLVIMLTAELVPPPAAAAAVAAR